VDHKKILVQQRRNAGLVKRILKYVAIDAPVAAKDQQYALVLRVGGHHRPLDILGRVGVGPIQLRINLGRRL
jgi:hypothetical protein